MRALRLHGPDAVRIDEVPVPTPGARDVLVRVHACGICGSDLGYVRRGGLGGPSGQPLPLGHEISGTIVSCGAEVTGWVAGDRVVVHPGDESIGRIGNGGPEGGLADLLLVREAADRLLRVPDGMDLTYAALTEPLAVGMHAAERLELGAGDSAVVIGGGPVGMAALIGLLDADLQSVIVVDPGAKRREIALALGAEAALDPNRPDLWEQIVARHGRHDIWSSSPRTNGYVECSGSDDALTSIIANAAPRSRISVPAVHLDDVPISILLVMMKELEIRGAIEYPDRFEDALDLLARRDVSAMVTDLIGLDEVVTGLTDPAGMRAAGKTMVIMDGR